MLIFRQKILQFCIPLKLHNLYCHNLHMTCTTTYICLQLWLEQKKCLWQNFHKTRIRKNKISDPKASNGQKIKNLAQKFVTNIRQETSSEKICQENSSGKFVTKICQKIHHKNWNPKNTKVTTSST